MAFLGQGPVRCKIFVNNKCLQVKHFKHFGSEISYENVQDIHYKKNQNFLKYWEFYTTILKPILIQKFSRIVYNELELPIR
jgi:hypothetical protein